MVTSAAVIMVAVFSIFTGMGQVELKMLGIGLPAAVLLDATVVRGVLVPAAMTLLGNRCWYLLADLAARPGSPQPRLAIPQRNEKNGRLAGRPETRRP